MATGMARGAAARHRRIAFGDGRHIIWGPWSKDIFRGNPNIAPPGSERASDLEWIAHYKGHRLYNHHGVDHWVWHMNFRPMPGEVFFTKNEQEFAQSIEPGFVLIEPNVPQQKSVAANKQWRIDRFEEVALQLSARNRVLQLKYQGAKHVLLGATEFFLTRTFREALALLSRAALYIGPEGGLHHGAAALGIPAVVLFGGFIPPQVTGYDMHTNLTGGATACGSLKPCNHCRVALDSIGVDQVVSAAQRHLRREI